MKDKQQDLGKGAVQKKNAEPEKTGQRWPYPFEFDPSIAEAAHSITDTLNAKLIPIDPEVAKKGNEELWGSPNQ